MTKDGSISMYLIGAIPRCPSRCHTLCLFAINGLSQHSVMFTSQSPRPARRRIGAPSQESWQTVVEPLGYQALGICASDTFTRKLAINNMSKHRTSMEKCIRRKRLLCNKVDRGPLDYHTTLTKNFHLYHESDSYTPQNFPLSEAFRSCNFV